MKKCTKCNEEKSLDSFGIRKNGGLITQCKNCVAKRSNDWYWSNREKSLTDRKNRYYETREETLSKRKERYERDREIILKRQREFNKKPEQREKANKRIREWNKKNPERLRERLNKYDKKFPEKKLARQSVMWAIRLGFMEKPNKCEICKKEIKTEAHHHDYNKHLEVNWYCRLCHMQFHCKDKHVGGIAL